MTEESTLGQSLVRWLESTGRMFMELDTDFTVLVADPKFQGRFGVRPGSKCYRSLMGADQVCPGCPVLPVFQGKESSAGRVAVRDVEGRLAYLHLNVVPLVESSGVVRGCAILAAEVGEFTRLSETWASAELDFEKILHQLPDVVFSLDSAGKFVFVNQRGPEFFGSLIPKILGKALWEFVAPEDAAKARHLVEVLPTVCWDEQLSIRDSISTEKFVRIRCTPRLDDDGNVQGFDGVMRDRTAQRKLEEALREYQLRLRASKHRYRRLVQQVPDVIFSLDTHGRFSFVNSQAEGLLGASVRQILGTVFWDHAAPEDVSLAKSILDVDAESVWDEEITVLDSNGLRKWVRIRCRPVHDMDGRLVEYEGVMRDRTSRRKLEEELRASKEELLEKIHIIDELYEHIVQSEKSKAIMEHTSNEG